ncbi:hypothetical protein D1641_10220 [Colidextribacter sp. OB.20]|nr:hypothetical protein [Colidextribacter sp. OB.20]
MPYYISSLNESPALCSTGCNTARLWPGAAAAPPGAGPTGPPGLSAPGWPGPPLAAGTTGRWSRS